MIKRALFLITSLSGFALAATPQLYIPSTSTFQGASSVINIASGTIQNFNSSTMTVTSGTVTNLNATTLNGTNISGGFVSTSGTNTWTGAQTFTSSVTVSSAIFTTDSSIQIRAFQRLGAVLNVICSSTTASSATAVTSAFANSNIAVTITPKLASDLIVGVVSMSAQNSTLASNNQLTIIRGSTNIGSASGWAGFNQAVASDDSIPSFIWWDLPNSASATTYTLAAKVSAGTLTINDQGVGVICAMDIGQVK